MSEEKKFGDIEFTGKDVNIRGIKFDKIAISGQKELLLVSLIADTQVVKQIRAVLAPNQTRVIAEAAGVKVNRAGDEPWQAHMPGRVNITTDGYTTYVHKLGFGMAHALFITKMPGFMKVVTPESLWKELNHVRFTTPIIQEWIPFLEEELRLSEHLTDAFVYNCKCGVLTATTAKIDEIVSEGLQQRLISIPSVALAG